jgi:hypothetical protein
LITQVKAGPAGVVLLTGESGVGKSRLARAGTEGCGLTRGQRLRWAARMRRMSLVSRSLYRSRIACRSFRSAWLL